MQSGPCFPGKDDSNIPADNCVHFQACGNYGSSIFDPSPREGIHHIEIVICDWCLVKNKDRVRLYLDDGIGSFEDRILRRTRPLPPRPAR